MGRLDPRRDRALGGRHRARPARPRGGGRASRYSARPLALAAHGGHTRLARPDGLEARRMSLIAAVRPGEQNLPLFLHVLGAMVLVGSLVLAMLSLAGPVRAGEAPVTRLGFRALLLGALPAWVVMRAGAEWVASKQGYEGDEAPSWIDVGYSVADPTLLFLLIALLLSGLSLRRIRGGGAGAGLVRAAAVLIALLLVADLVAIYAMTTKPT